MEDRDAASTGERPVERRWSTAALVALAVIAVVPIATTFLRAAPDWIATGDSAVLVLRSDDVFTGHTPLLGMPSSVGQSTGEPTHHPGPSELWAIALVRAVVDTSWGPALAIAMVNAAAAVLAVVAGHRLGGLRVAAGVAAGVAVLGWSLQGPFLVDPFNPYAGLLPFAALLVAGAAAARDARWLPVAAGLGSYAAQAHLTYVPMVAALAVVVAWSGWRRSWRPDRQRLVRAVGATVAVVAAFWWPALIDQVVGQGNLAAVLGASGGDADRVGWSLSVRTLVNGLGTPVWLDSSADVTGLVLPVGVREVAVSAGTAMALAWAAVTAPPRALLRLAALLVVVTAAAGMLTLALIPDRAPNVLALHNYLWVWVVGIGAAGAVAARLSRRLAATFTTWVAASVAVVAAGAAAVAGPARPIEPSWAEATRRLVPAVAASLRCDATYLVEEELDYAPGGVSSGLFLALDDAGFDVRVDRSRRRTFGDHRVARRGEADARVDVAVDEPASPEEIAAVTTAGVRYAVRLHPRGPGTDAAGEGRPHCDR